eukprot:4756042-Pleurochrysis_carterae.AAC.2
MRLRLRLRLRQRLRQRSQIEIEIEIEIEVEIEIDRWRKRQGGRARLEDASRGGKGLHRVHSTRHPSDEGGNRFGTTEP